MTTANPEVVEIARRYAEDYRVAQRDMYADLLRTAAKVVACIVASLYLIGMSVHVTDAGTGGVYFASGFLFWVSSVSVLLLNAYQRGVHRGDWM